MTEQEAIKRINGSSQYAYNHFGFVDKDGEAFDMAIKALEKQIPKKPSRWQDGYSCCSNCKRGIIKEDRFCCYCGQRIDWSEVEA